MDVKEVICRCGQDSYSLGLGLGYEASFSKNDNKSSGSIENGDKLVSLAAVSILIYL
jgi:hypothetical protein